MDLVSFRMSIRPHHVFDAFVKRKRESVVGGARHGESFQNSDRFLPRYPQTRHPKKKRVIYRHEEDDSDVVVDDGCCASVDNEGFVDAALKTAPCVEDAMSISLISASWCDARPKRTPLRV